MAEYWVRLKTKLNLREAIEPLRQYYSVNSKLPLSRLHTLELTDEQAEAIKQLPNVLDVQKTYEIIDEPIDFFNKRSSCDLSGYQYNVVSQIPVDRYQQTNWGILECIKPNTTDSDIGCNVGNDYAGQAPAEYWKETDVDFYSEGRDVDVIIVDSPIPHNHPEFNDAEGNSRFVQFDWSSLHDYVEDELGIPLYSPDLESPWNYCSHEDLAAINHWFNDHGLNCATISAGLHNGFAKRANIYALHIDLGGSSVKPATQSMCRKRDMWPIVRAFHLLKGINPVTGKKNPTIVNCSFGSRPGTFWPAFNEIKELQLDGVIYSSSNPLPYGWNVNSFFYETNCDLNNGIIGHDFPDDALIDDGQEDGVIFVAGAANNQQYGAPQGHPSYDNYIKYDFEYEDMFTGEIVVQEETKYFARSGRNSPIYVGSLGPSNLRVRASHSNFGPGVDIWAPGENILASSIASGLWDEKYGTDLSGNQYKLNFIKGTSFATPHVVGVLACAASASNKHRYTYSDAINYLNQTSQSNGIQEHLNDYYFKGVYDPNNVNGSSHLDIDAYSKLSYQDGCTIDGWDEVNNRIIFGFNGDRTNNDGRDIYGTAIEDVYGDTVYTIYEGHEGSIRFGVNVPIDEIEVVNTDTNEVIGSPIIDDFDLMMGMLSLNQKYNYIDAYGHPRLTIRKKDNINVKANFEFLPNPNGTLNYKFNNFTYLGDSTKRTLVMKPIKPQQGSMYSPIGQRTSGLTYPRSLRTYAAI